MRYQLTLEIEGPHIADESLAENAVTGAFLFVYPPDVPHTPRIVRVVQCVQVPKDIYQPCEVLT